MSNELRSRANFCNRPIFCQARLPIPDFASWRRTPISTTLDEISKTGLVPLAGLEPAQCCHYLILSQARLPIPPQGQAGGIIVGNGVGSTLCVAVPTQ
jgi:hypothetical protein